MMLLAAVEHAARTFVKALAERCCGPAGYEDSDYYDAERWLIPPVDPATLRTAKIGLLPEEWFVERGAEEEVAEPEDRTGLCTAALVIKGEHFWCDSEPPNHPGWAHGNSAAGAIWDGPPTSSSTTPSASQPPVDDDSWPADSDIPPSPAGQPPTVPAEVSARTPTPAPSAGLTWIQWAIPGIQDVLAAHVCSYNEDCATFECWEDGDLVPHASFDDPQEWREHVAPAIAERLETAWRARQSRQFIETGHDMGASMACETFPQYRGGRS